jgi:hypothetical protein
MGLTGAAGCLGGPEERRTLEVDTKPTVNCDPLCTSSLHLPGTAGKAMQGIVPRVIISSFQILQAAALELPPWASRPLLGQAHRRLVSVLWRSTLELV